jgi:hypothetical protein
MGGIRLARGAVPVSTRRGSQRIRFPCRRSRARGCATEIVIMISAPTKAIDVKAKRAPGAQDIPFHKINSWRQVVCRKMSISNSFSTHTIA